jgi:uncharacterized membrane protein (Fun14 family)
MNSIVESFGSAAATMGGGFFIEALIGYALKKVIKLLAVIVGLFLAGLAYLQYHYIANINWDKLQTVSEGMLMTVANLTMQVQGISGVSGDGHGATIALLAITSFGIPLSSSMSVGFTIGFMKG